MMIHHRAIRTASLWLAAGTLIASAHAAQTDLATAPLVTSASQDVLPNLMFILDDSGSMAWTHVPDVAENFAGSRYGYRSAQCNGLYYNPNVVYAPPVAANGAPFPAASFTAAWTNGYNQSAGTVNLSNAFQAWTYFPSPSTTDNRTDSDTAQRAYYYTYSGSQLTDALRDYSTTTSAFYLECNSVVGATPGSAVFTRVDISDTSTERTNFANWYSYYRTRMLLMKTQTGRAFQTIGDRYRVGYMSINNNVSPSLLNIDTFATGQKTNWFAKLYGATPNNGTPLREALSNAGRIYAKKISTLYGATVTDPVQYSCQKNFSLLSTDGYWNGNDGFQLNGTTDIGQQDGTDPRPYNDGTTSTTIYTATLTVSGFLSFLSTSVSSVRVNGFELMSGPTGLLFLPTPTLLAGRIRDKINDCTSSTTGNCTVSGYSAVRAGNVVTITAPAALGATPVVIKSGPMSVSASAFSAATVTLDGPWDTLADVAAYYYETDLRTSGLGNVNGALGTDVTQNNVAGGGEDDANWQHMTTFTLGLGARGRLRYAPNYQAGGSDDYNAVRNGTAATATVCTWQTAGTTCNWPTPAADLPENIDDMWHAAVNGRGIYFSATDATSLSVGVASALQEINAVESDASAATVSNPNITTGDNFLFVSTFKSGAWTGELERRQIDVSTGELLTTVDWKAQDLLDANTSRTIHTYDATNVSTRLKPFLWGNLSAAEQTWFSTPHISTMSQFCPSGNICLDGPSKAAAAGNALVNFLRGDRSNEGISSDTSKYFRLRQSVLGDIVTSEAVYVAKPRYDYVDGGYASFKTSNASRTKMVYVGANDGMLHAFNAQSGEEAWAYVPALLMPTLYKLADKYYAGNHQHYVDSTPTYGDAYFGGAWHTILVGGLGSGGRGYYALDVTDPASPKALWEFSDANMGFSHGRPEITKLKDGTWVALLTSGYNNVGDGVGRLYVVNLATGLPIPNIPTGISTGAGSVGTPSGLAQIRAYVENTRFDNTTQRVYGGDNLGNVWRFDVNGDTGASGYDAQLLATLRDSSGNAQPVTTRPELGKIEGFPVVYVGTGRYLGTPDLLDTSRQSLYAIKDKLLASGHGNPRSASFVQQTLTAPATCPVGSQYCDPGQLTRTASNNAVNFVTDNGWFIDLPGTGERISTDPQLALGTLAVVSNLPSALACSPGGTAYLNFFDYKTGAAVATADGLVSVFLNDGLYTGPQLVRTESGETFAGISGSNQRVLLQPIPVKEPSGKTRRTSWRQLVTE